MKKAPLGCFTPIGMLATLAAVLAISAAVMMHGGAMFSPGPLNAVQGAPLNGVHSHAEIGGNCSACHTPPLSSVTMSTRCLDCHQNIQAELADANQIHGALRVGRDSFECRECHTEHKGADASIIQIDTKTFPHFATGFSLTAHTKLTDGAHFQCQDCHGDNLMKLDQVVCSTCHEKMNADFMAKHTSQFGSDCLACHDGKDSRGSAFDHNMIPFPLMGEHNLVDCQACHQGATDLKALQSTPIECVDCHKKDDKHQGLMGDNCAFCHTPAAWDQTTFDHTRSGFALDGKHAEVDCVSCHANATFKGTPTDCVSCHQKEDAHQGKFGTDCAACHTSQGWQPPTFDHAKSAFPLDGVHQTVQCAACHPNRTYQGTPTDCIRCHQKDDQHQGLFGTVCTQCHTTEGWDKVIFDHATIGFNLVGKHTTVDCTACHTKGLSGTATNCAGCHQKDDQHQGQFGTDCALCHTPADWSQVIFNHANTAFPLNGSHAQAQCVQCHTGGKFKGTPTNCYTCHVQDDKHGGMFGTDCTLCHTTDRWSNITFNHANTVFPLTGAHGNVACTQCHTDGKFRGLPSNCAACHASDDKHGGQFGADCAACHVTSSWKNVSFDHSTTAFPLSGAHGNVACQQCHTNGKFKGTPANCAACHAQDDKHNGQFGTDCAACHVTSSWGNVSFDHNVTGFPLTGAHGSATCQQCHTNGQFKATPSNCAACHASDDKHNGQFGTDCAACHSTSSWSGASFDHAQTGFPLNGAHSNIACQQCHANGQFSGTSAQCSACHSEPAFHTGMFGADCAACHSSSTWVPASFNQAHAFPIHHGRADTCRDCHTSSLTTYTCYTCHDQSKIEKKHREEGISNFANCAECHANGGHEGGRGD